MSVSELPRHKSLKDDESPLNPLLLFSERRFMLFFSLVLPDNDLRIGATSEKRLFILGLTQRPDLVEVIC